MIAFVVAAALLAHSEAKFVPLFNGTDLTGWKPSLKAGSENPFAVKDGGVAVTGKGGKWPARIAKPFVSDVPAFTCDLLPTAIAAAGGELPKGTRALDGISLLPVLDKKATERSQPILFHSDDHKQANAKNAELGQVGFAVVDGKWKLLSDRANKKSRRFDVVADVGETKDVSAANPDVVTRLRAAREAWWKSVQADLPRQERARPAFTSRG